MKPVAGFLSRTGRQAPRALPSLPGDHFRHDLRIAGQIGKPAEQGRCLPKNEGSKLCLSLSFSDIRRGYTSASHLAVTPAAMEQWSSGIWAELVETAQTRELVELEPWLNGCPCPPQRNHSCLHLCFQVQSGKFPPLVIPEWVGGKVSCGWGASTKVTGWRRSEGSMRGTKPKTRC